MRNEIQRRLQRAKYSERVFAKFLTLHDGPSTRFPPGQGVTTTTGRVGHITGLQFDCISLHYAGENKNMKVPATLWKAWVQIVQVARREGLEPVLRIDPTNDQTSPPTPNMVVITEDHYAELLERHEVHTSIELLPDVVHNYNGTLNLSSGRPYTKEEQIGQRKKNVRR